MSNPVQINMYGIRYFIDGDLSDPHVKKLMVQARNDLQGMKDRNINDIDHIWMNKPQAYKVVSQFGIDSVYIDVPSFGEEKQRGWKERTSEVTKEDYRFVPAIILGNEDITESGYITIPWQEVGDINVCAGANWEGTLDLIKDSPTANLPNEIYKDGIVDPDKYEIRACRNWGNRDFYFYSDTDEDRSVVNLVDPGFVPAPYADYIVDALNAVKSATVVKSVWTIFCDEVQVAYEEYLYTEDEFNLYFWHWDDADGDWTKTILFVRSCFMNSNLWFKYRVDAYAQKYGPGAVCAEYVHTVPVPLTIVGSAQDRLVIDYTWTAYYASAEDYYLTGRSSGEILFGPSWYHYGDLEDCTYHLTLPAPCEPYQSDVIILSEVYPLYYGVCGAYIQDQVDEYGDELQICPIESFYNLYCILVVEEWWEYARTSTEDFWYISDGPHYDEYEVYQQGTVNNTQENWNVSQDETYRVLVVNLNDERIEIDRTDDIGDEFTHRSDYFYFTDSLILDFMGTPVYMYGYIRTRYESGKYNNVYTRYGYFLNGVHYQSEKFYPSGITDWRGYTSCLHDVYGSIARDGKYGFGQCAGFAVKETTKQKGPTQYVQEI